MSYMKTIQALALSFTLSTICCMADVSNDQRSSKISSSIPTIVGECIMKGCGSHKDHRDSTHLLQLSDFAGDWIFGVDSIGGLSGILTVGSSETIDGQVTFDRHGNGTVNFVSAALYLGIPGEVGFASGSDDATVTLTITDPQHGIGFLVASVPSLNLTRTADFVVIRSHKTGKVIGFEGHSTSATHTTTHISSYSFQRQFQ